MARIRGPIHFLNQCSSHRFIASITDGRRQAGFGGCPRPVDLLCFEGCHCDLPFPKRIEAPRDFQANWLIGDSSQEPLAARPAVYAPEIAIVGAIRRNATTTHRGASVHWGHAQRPDAVDRGPSAKERDWSYRLLRRWRRMKSGRRKLQKRSAFPRASMYQVCDPTIRSSAHGPAISARSTPSRARLASVLRSMRPSTSTS